MEMAQKKILEQLNLSPFDLRLRNVREKARISFDRAWASGLQQGIIEQEEDAVSLYAYCLERSLNSEGIKVPPEALPNDERIAQFVEKGT
jgi:hypothetical protein